MSSHRTQVETARRHGGLLPFIYKVIIQYRAAYFWFSESPPAPYARHPGDPGHFKSLPCSPVTPPTGSHLIASAGNPSPHFSTFQHVYS
ncbi:hypothetical protein ACOSP7_024961 [Xanthoceras sorbifolium]